MTLLWLLFPVAAVCVGVLCRYVFALADTLTAPADEPDSGHGAPGPGTPLDDLPPDSIDWDDLLFRLAIWNLTERTPA